MSKKWDKAFVAIMDVWCDSKATHEERYEDLCCLIQEIDVMLGVTEFEMQHHGVEDD